MTTTTELRTAAYVLRTFRAARPLSAVKAATARADARRLLQPLTLAELRAVEAALGLTPCTGNRKAPLCTHIVNAAEQIVREETSP